jgi:GNAT superfamily N-acetyltransferase
LALSSTTQSFSRSPAYVIRTACPKDRWALYKMRLMTPKGPIANLLVIILLMIPLISALYIVSNIPFPGRSPELDIIAFLIVGMPLSIYLTVLFWVLVFQPLSYSEIWVIECNNKLFGSAKFIQYDTYSYLDQLFVFPAYRNQGIGSDLVHYCMRRGQNPIYLLCQPALTKYYARLGFTPIAKDNLPQELQSKFGYFGYQALGLM